MTRGGWGGGVGGGGVGQRGRARGGDRGGGVPESSVAPLKPNNWFEGGWAREAGKGGRGGGGGGHQRAVWEQRRMQKPKNWFD